MKKFAILSLALACSMGFGFDNALNKAKNATGIDLPKAQWKLPNGLNEDGTIDESKLPDSPYIKMVVLGSKIITQSHNYIGPNAKNEDMRLAGNHLSCASCHTTKPNQTGFIGIWGRFPQYIARGDGIATLENRINGCMQRSMNGKPLPFNSKEMKAMLSYFHFLSQGIAVGAKTESQGLPAIKYISRAADPAKGKAIYETKCASCHGANGEGVKNPDSANADYYTYPPLWGDDSYNTGAGMYRLLKAASYIKSSMPQNEANLSDEEAFDVSAYINTQKRPILEGREKDFPNRAIKPVDMDVGPYDDDFSTEEHRFGPYEKMFQ
ncbi:MAG: c-type cytochrome [Campylobacter sp.]|nr:c-type cytochrome [Campylobacter sp.]